MSGENKASRLRFGDLVDAYVRMLVAGVKPAAARLVMDLYLEEF